MTPAILLVDDDLVMLDTLKDVLEEGALQVQTASKIGEALALLEQNAFQLMITDFNLPDGLGVDLAGKARGLYPNLGILLMTGNAELKLEPQGLGRDIDSYLVKPVDPAHLIKTIHEILGKKR